VRTFPEPNACARRCRNDTWSTTPVPTAAPPLTPRDVGCCCWASGVGGVGGGGQGNALSLINALDSVLQAQNGLVQDWVVYETNRLNIFRDMGIMEIDARGVWTDRFYLQMQTSVPVEGVSPPAAASEAPSVVPAVPATQDVVPGVSE